nr:integrase, catalytic region, zinc finger, CCHC-type, peptidase aspartic, catalytic [Tanacetum cinerariifolium]
MLLVKKDKDEQVLLVEDQAWIESSSDSDQEINANMVFIAQIEKVLSDSKASSSSADEKISEVSYYLSKSKSESEFETSKYYDNSTAYGLFVNNNDDQEIFHDEIESASENFIENHIDSQKDHDKSDVDHNDFKEKDHLVDKKQIADQEVFYDKISVQLIELDKHVTDLKNTTLEKVFKISELEECVRNKDLEIEKCLEHLNVFENKHHKIDQTNRIVHMIMPSKDNLYNGRKGIGFENPSYFEKAKDLRPTLYDEKQTSSLKPYVPNVILEKIIIDLEDEVVNLLEKEKANLETIESLKSKGFKSSENVSFESENQSENDCLVVEKECDKEENPKVIAPAMFKLNVSQCISPISMSKSSYLDTLSSVRRPKNSSVIWKKKGSSNTSNVDLSAVSISKLNKNVKRYSRKDLLACNNSHIGETRSSYVCNDAMNVSCNSRMCDLLDDNNFFIFDDVNIRISPVSKMPIRKKPRDSMNVCSKSNLNTSLPRTVHKWLPKMKSLAEPIAKWIPRIVQICLWIIDSGCSKHMTGNRALLTNFVGKFLETVRFGNNDFVVIAGYGYGLEVAFRKSTCFARNEDGVDLLTGDHSSNLYTIALNEVASNSSTCLLAKASSSQSWRPSLYDEKVIGLGYTPMFLIHSDEALEIKKFKRARENKIKFAYDFGNLNASYVNGKIIFSDDYFQEIINPDFEKIDYPSQQTSSLKPYFPTVILEKIIIDLENEVTRCAYVCNDAMNVSCNSRLCDSFDENNLFIFDDESVRVSPVSKMTFRKNPRDSLDIVQICLWIIDSGCSKHMTSIRALLTNFVEKFLGTVRFGNNDFAVIAGYGDVVIGSVTIKKVYYVEGLGHNLFSVGQFCLIAGLEVAFRKSTCFV